MQPFTGCSKVRAWLLSAFPKEPRMFTSLALRNRKPLARLALAITLGTLGLPYWADNAQAHGGHADMVPLQEGLEAFGATVKWDDYANLFTIAKDGVYLKVKPDSKVAMLNGKRIELTVPVVFKDHKAFMSTDFINQVFQSGLDKTFVVETRPNPLNPLSAAEINTAVDIAKKSDNYKPGFRFTEVSVKAPPKDQVWNFALTGQNVAQPREASIVVLDGKHVIEALVDLDTKTLKSWKPIEGAHGMVLLDDFATVQSAVESSPEYAQALAKRGINDVKKVVATPLTVGYFDGKDGLAQDKRLLKIVSYLNTGDGNYWAHPIEGLVAIVDLEQKKLIKIEDDALIPVPLKPTPYDGRGRQGVAVKPLEIIEPEGKNYTISGNSIHWQNWDFHVRLDSRVGPIRPPLPTTTRARNARSCTKARWAA